MGGAVGLLVLIAILFFIFRKRRQNARSNVHQGPGISELRARITIAGDADEQTLREIAQRGYDASPVRDSVDRGVAFKPEVVAG